MEEAKRRKIHRAVQAGEFGPAEMVFQVLGTTIIITKTLAASQPINDIITNHLHPHQPNQRQRQQIISNQAVYTHKQFQHQ